MKNKTKKIAVMSLALAVILTFAACGNNTDNTTVSETENSTTVSSATTTLPSPDKYTRYIKNYVGKNCASIGYDAMNGKRMDEYGDSFIELVFVSDDGCFIDITNEDELKNYTVTKQNIEPGTELKLTFLKDEEGNEYDNLVASQSFKEIVLCVKKAGSTKGSAAEPVVINPSPDKYTHYIVDYSGRNLASCGYVSMMGKLTDAYGDAYIELVIVTQDGTFVGPEDAESLKNYVVTSQNIAPNTELKLTFDKDENGKEYDNLVQSQNIEEIELYVSRVDSEKS